MIRPQPARWFEILVARDDAFVALEGLAMAGCAEIEWHATELGADATAAANRMMRDYGAFARRYRAYLPPARLRPTEARVAPSDAFARALAALRLWADEADPVILRLQAAETEAARLATAGRVMAELRGSAIDFTDLAAAGGRVHAYVFVYPIGANIGIPPSLLVRSFAVGDEVYALTVGTPIVLETLSQDVTAVAGRKVNLPGWLQPTAEENLALIDARRPALDAEIASLRAELDAIAARHGVAEALGDIARSMWCFENAGAIESGDVLARITGWTSEPARLAAAIETADARALASFPPAPRGVRPPMLLRNPWWARPFELFSRLFGVPDETGADPSALLAIAAPLLFGYMFGDVGQGLVLAAVGLALQRQVPALRLLVPGGVSAAIFGLLFGSVFSVEHLFHPLWLNPLERPLEVLAVPLVGGAILLLLGLALDALGAYWRGALGDWVATEGGFVLVYLGVLGALADSRAWLLVPAGAALFALGHARLEGRAIAGLKALGELLERTIQILVNTLSFARVGAFALAHAGLSSAVVALAHAAGEGIGFVIVLAVGNVVIIALEGLVVSIQTTRLVLFEFFARFFRSRGREFRPLLPPPATPEIP